VEEQSVLTACLWTSEGIITDKNPRLLRCHRVKKIPSRIAHISARWSSGSLELDTNIPFMLRIEVQVEDFARFIRPHTI
jgi:hypothetical protein